MNEINALVQFGIAGAVVLVVTLFLRFLREERKDSKDFFANHLSRLTEQSTRTSEILSTLTETIRKCPGPGDKEIK